MLYFVLYFIKKCTKSWEKLMSLSDKKCTLKQRKTPETTGISSNFKGFVFGGDGGIRTHMPYVKDCIITGLSKLYVVFYVVFFFVRRIITHSVELCKG